MMASDLLSELQGLGIRLKARGDRLMVDAPWGVLTDALREAIHTHKGELVTTPPHK